MLIGKLNILIDGQFGSTGKGLFASYIGTNEHIDIAISNAGPNAGHTFFDKTGKRVAYHLPVAGLVNTKTQIYLTAGSIIDPDILLKEMETFDVSPDRIAIDPRAAIIEEIDKSFEKDPHSSLSAIASTQKGVGHALARKILREAQLAENNVKIKHLVRNLNLSDYLDQNRTIFMEVPQGLGLGINSGLSYPYVTSREISISQALADAQVHPSYLGHVYLSLRAYPIRVGHLVIDNKKIGDSGPFYPDSCETTWERLGLEKELTTNTKRVRRIASFSLLQYAEAIKLLKPDYILLNFANYMNTVLLSQLIKKMNKIASVTHLGFGPYISSIVRIEK